MEENYLQKSRKKPFWSYIFFVLGVLLIIFILSATLFGLIFLQSVDESLDIRKQALEVSKRVDFDTYPFTQSFFKVQEPSRIELQINTYNHYVDALELGLQIKTDQGLLAESDLQITQSRDQVLKLVQSNIQQIACDPQQDCYLITLLLITNQASEPFTSRNVSTSIANLEFVPKKEGAITLELTQASQITEHGTGQNILQNRGASKFNYYVSNNGIDFAQCRYVYGDWGECENFWQTRQYQVAPLNCHWHQTETLETLSRQCNENQANNSSLANAEDFSLHYFANCLSNNDQGENFYLVWNTQQYPGFDWLDVSLDHHFSSFYQKSTKTAEKIGDYAIINLTEFSGFSQDVKGQILTFRADQNYYFRLYNDQTEEFIFGPKLYLSYCNQEQSTRLNCQDACIQTNQGSNCQNGLSCINGRCLLESNPESPWCFDESLLSQAVGVGSVAGVSTQIADTTVIIQGPFLPSEIYDLTTYACNHGCNTNRDCMADYRCYQGHCRLASNPESPTCEEADVVDDSEIIEQKGGIIDDQQAIIDQLLPTNSPIPSPTPELIEEDLATSSSEIEEKVTVEPSPKEETQEIQTEAESPAIFANLSAALNDLFNKFNWQYLALAGLLIIIAIVFIFLGLSQDPRQAKKKQIKSKTKNKDKKKEVVIPENKELDL
jgi:uncharacterized protein YpmS